MRTRTFVPSLGATSPKTLRLCVAACLLVLVSMAPEVLASEVGLDTTQNRSRIVGSGRIAEESRPVLGVWGVSLLSEGRVIVAQGTKESLSIRAEDNLLPHITTEVMGGMLRIGSDAELEPTKPIEYLLTVRRLETAELAGAGAIDGSDLTVQSLALRLLGAGSFHF